MTKSEWEESITAARKSLEESQKGGMADLRAAYALQGIGTALCTISAQLQDIYGLMIEEMVEDDK